MSTFYEEAADEILLRLANTAPDQHKDIISRALLDAEDAGAQEEARYLAYVRDLTGPIRWSSLESYENDH
jgi:hypothetical protein